MPEYKVDHTSAHWIFVAEFSDGTITRMTTFAPNGGFDMKRGIRLSQYAYESRKKTPALRIVAAKFVDPESDATVRSYGREDLDACQ